MAGDAKDAERRKISRYITCSREADWETMWKRISSLSAANVIDKSISVPRSHRLTPTEGGVSDWDSEIECGRFSRSYL
jgi:hypothetical protein